MKARDDRAATLDRMHQPNDRRSIEEFVGGRDLTSWPSLVGRTLAQVARWLARFVSANVVLVVSSIISAGVLIGLTATSAEVYEAVSEGDGLAGLDRPVLELAINGRSPANVEAVNVYTQLGGPWWMPVIAGVVIVVMMIRWRSRTPLVLMLIGVAGSLLMTSVGKVVVGRVRPPLTDAVPPYESSPSFPSGHTLNSTVIAALVGYLLLLRLTSTLARVLAVTGAVLWFTTMGLSRVFLGHHWLTDVVMGWTLGLGWVAAVITTHRLFLTVRRLRADRGVEPQTAED